MESIIKRIVISFTRISTIHITGTVMILFGMYIYSKPPTPLLLFMMSKGVDLELYAIILCLAGAMRVSNNRAPWTVFLILPLMVYISFTFWYLYIEPVNGVRNLIAPLVYFTFFILLLRTNSIEITHNAQP
jgi:hypothetical protein